MYAVLDCFKWQLAVMTLPRIALIGFTYAQPFLISSVINHLAQANTSVEKNAGYGLIGATALIYAGIAVCSLNICMEVNKNLRKLAFNCSLRKSSLPHDNRFKMRWQQSL
jgi:hypothetical protein